MVPEFDTADLIDAHEVAETLGLSHRNSVSPYQRRYPDTPPPVMERGGGRTKLWLRQKSTAGPRALRRMISGSWRRRALTEKCVELPSNS